MKQEKSRLVGTRGTALFTVLLFTFVLTALVTGILEWSLTERYTTTRYARWLEARNAAEAVCEYGVAQVYNEYSTYETPGTQFFNPTGTTALKLPPTTFWSDTSVDTSTSSSDTCSMQLIAGPEMDVSTPGYGNLYYVKPYYSLGTGSTSYNDLYNMNDPSANPSSSSSGSKTGMAVTRRDIQVIARVAVKSPGDNGAPIVSYVSETCSVRGQSLFGYAVFYSNNDMEVQPGPNFNINGPVHVNGNLFVSAAQGGSGTTSVNFQNTVQVTGGIFRAWAGTTGNSPNDTEDNGTLGVGNITFLNAAGTAQAYMNAGKSGTNYVGTSTGTTYLDSTFGADSGKQGTAVVTALLETSSGAISTVSQEFVNFSGTTWGSNVNTGAMTAGTLNPVEFNEVVGMSGTVALTPDFHTLIDPPVQVSTASNSYEAAQVDTEDAKLANQAGLYILVSVTPGTTAGSVGTASIKAYGYPGSAEYLVTSPTAGQIGPNLLDPTNSTTGGLLLNLPVGSGTGTNGPMVTWMPFQETWKTTQTSTQTVTTTARLKTVTTTTTSVTYTLTDAGTAAIGSSVASNSAASSTSITTGTNSNVTSTGAVSSPTGTTVASGMVDQRRYLDGQTVGNGVPGIDEVRVNVGQITAAVNDMINNSTTDGNAITYTTGTGSSAVTKLWNGWNGGIYIDVESAGSTADSVPTLTDYANGVGTESTTQAAGYVYSQNQAASVYLWNAGLTSSTAQLIKGSRSTGAGTLYEYPTGGSGTDAPSQNPYGNGLTIATNAPVYILGNYNGDGSYTSGADTTPDNGWTATSGVAPLESPSYIAADAVTILSPGWSDSGSWNPSTPSVATSTASGEGSTANTEIGAALVTGITPTGSYYSGGLHNLPRFLENWGSDQVVIRGAISCFFPSAVAAQPWMQAYYSAPERMWGYNSIFAAGYLPPLSPSFPSFRRLGYQDLSPTQYTTDYNAMISAY